MKLKSALLVVLACIPMLANAQCEIQVHLVSVHASNESFNNDTHGVGALCNVTDNTQAAIGTYQNSINRRSNYAAIVWQPLNVGPIKLGVIGGVVSGYQNYLIPLAGAVASMKVTKGASVHLLVIPEVSNITPTVAELSVSFRF